ncbi:MAG: S46 family peptidase [Bacteroidales bacterium]|nr:S46 family peptidase [Bacteroidales bacterium]
MRKLFLALIALLILAPAKADEGMWLLPLLAKYNIATMQQLGCKLSADDIYNVNKASLKDAVVIFGRGCTGEVVSDKGLVFTNHHCGYSEIQSVSSLEHNYLRDGFFAHSVEEEIPIPGLSVQFLKQITDITDEYLAAKAENKADSIRKKYESESDAANGKRVRVTSFFDGNQYFKIEYEVYTDIRLVATPSDMLGKFGGDTDNWVWPRHTCDFSVFRIYADKNGRPAEYNEQNVPFKPKKFLNISLAGVQEGDYAMTIGYPGSTNRYNSSNRIKSIVENTNSPRVQVRGAKQDVWSAAMQADEQTRIRYAAKYAGSSNYWKNAIGQNRCINRLNVIQKRQAEEAEFAKWADKNGYGDLLSKEAAYYEKYGNALKARTYYSETFYNGIEAVGIADDMVSLVSNGVSKDDIKKVMDSYYKDYDVEVDKKVAVTLLKLYRDCVSNKNYFPNFYNDIDGKYNGDYQRFVDDVYSKSIFTSQERFEKFWSENAAADSVNTAALDNDVLYNYMKTDTSYWNILDEFKSADLVAGDYQNMYTGAIMKWKANKKLYPGANFTMRLSYGTVKSYEPADAIKYAYYTTVKGYLEKICDTANYDYAQDAKFVEKVKTGDYVMYADKKDGLLHTCFITTNDITGGNSGSPVINGKGELIGLAFDGNWESMAGDFMYDDDLTRCVCVDIRYVLYVIDYVGGAKNIIKELKIKK